MIRMSFVIRGEVLRIEIINREIYYGDRKWQRMIRLIPKDEEFIKKIELSRNAIPYHLTELFNLTPEEQQEYDEAVNDEELAQNCIRDIRIKGGKLVRKEVLK